MGTSPVQRLKWVRTVNTIINNFVTLSHKSIMERKKFLIIINPVTPMSEFLFTISSRQVMIIN